MPVTMDTSRWPLAVAQFVDTPTDEDFAGYLAGLDGLIARAQPFAIIIDSSASNMAHFRHRRLQAEWLKHNKPAIKQWCRGAVVVAPTLLMRTVIATILLLQGIAAPHLICGSREEAERWAKRRLTEG